MINKKKKEIKRILAMDLSLNLPAFAVLDIVEGKVLVKDTYYCDNKKEHNTKSHGERLARIRETIRQVISEYPDVQAVVREKGFSRFAATTQALFKVVGVSDLAIFEDLGITKIDEIAPTSVKRLVAYDGKASKLDVEVAVREHLVPLQKDIEFYSDDVSDAVGVGIAWFIKNGYLE